jgi:hypothetical protein
VQPVGEHLSWHNRPGLSSEDQKSSLKGILGVVVVREDTTADPPNHPAMATYQRRKRRLVSPFDETAQELSIGQSRTVATKRDMAQVLHHICHSASRHVYRPTGVTLRPLPYYYPIDAGFIEFFL